jgi:hypothetical protein
LFQLNQKPEGDLYVPNSLKTGNYAYVLNKNVSKGGFR